MQRDIDDDIEALKSISTKLAESLVFDIESLKISPTLVEKFDNKTKYGVIMNMASKAMIDATTRMAGLMMLIEDKDPKISVDGMKAFDDFCASILALSLDAYFMKSCGKAARAFLEKRDPTFTSLKTRGFF